MKVNHCYIKREENKTIILTLSPMHIVYHVDDMNIIRYLNPTCKLTQPQVPP